MSDPRHTVQPEETFDTEIPVKTFAVYGLWLVAAVLVIIALMYWLYRDFQHREMALDAPESPLVDRSKPRLPPEPHLQVTPERDLAAYQAAEHQRVESYGWVDEKLGIVHIPVSRAMDLLAEKGLPARGVAEPVIPLPVPSPPPGRPGTTRAAGGHR